jgi:NADH-quinone oxidoreductase subunit N
MLFKIAAAPFHIWSPDVYQGAPTAATSFFAAIAKFASAIAIIEIFRFLAITWKNIDQIFIFTAILSLIVGALGAIKQNNIKRLLAYSSIGHIGFILSSLAIFHPFYSFAGLTIYIIIYSFASIGVFAFLLSLYNSSKGQIDEINNQKYNINSLAGIAKSNPILAASLTILIFSFAGIPPMSGFFSKFYILFSMVKSGHYILALIAIISSVISCFYYLRIVKIMYFDKKIENSTISIIRCNANIILIISAIIAIAAPLYFSPLINLVEGNIIHIFKNGG